VKERCSERARAGTKRLQQVLQIGVNARNAESASTVILVQAQCKSADGRRGKPTREM
jgi:hypothetical protein